MSKMQNLIARYQDEGNSLIEKLLQSPHFDVREDGTIWSQFSKNGAGLVPNGVWRRVDHPENKDGRYFRVSVSAGCLPDSGIKRKRGLRAHRIVYAKFHGPLLGFGYTINHKDGNPSNNRPENLEQITTKENNDHKYQVLGHDPIQNFKLSFEIADEIRQLRAQGWPYRALCEKYEISKGHVSEIVNRKIWVRT